MVKINLLVNILLLMIRCEPVLFVSVFARTAVGADNIFYVRLYILPYIVI